MINVEDGDAIILMLQKGTEKALILIDGGYKKHYHKLKKRLKQVLPHFNNKIDLVVCTHYDNDHLGGVEKVIDDYHNIIEEIWIHKIYDTLDEQIDFMDKKLKLLEGHYSELNRMNQLVGTDASSGEMVMEGYKDLLRVIRKIVSFNLESKVVEATRGQVLQGFEEFKVMGPTPDYYNKHLSDLKKEGIKEDMQHSVLEKQSLLESASEHSEAKKMKKLTDLINPCSKLEKSSVAKRVSATNMVSIVTLLNANNKKYLFTGDAGIESFQEEDLLDQDLKNIDWLDLPHHGSKNNTSKIMLDHFNPKVVLC